MNRPHRHIITALQGYIHVACPHCALDAATEAWYYVIGTQFQSIPSPPSQRVTAAPNPHSLYRSLPVDSVRVTASVIVPRTTLLCSLTAVDNAEMTIPHAPHSSN